MDWKQHRGVLGVSFPIFVNEETEVGYVTQFFSKIELHVSTRVISSWNLKGEPACKFIDDAIHIVDEVKQVKFLKARPWGDIVFDSCVCTIKTDGSLYLVLAKSEACEGSWPFPLQSLSVACPIQSQSNQGLVSKEGKEEMKFLSSVIEENKEAYLELLHTTAPSIIKESCMIANEFAETVDQQMKSIPRGPLGQTIIVFPGDRLVCSDYLMNAQHLPAVKRLVSHAENLMHIDINEICQRKECLKMSRSLSLLVVLLSGLAKVEELFIHKGIQWLSEIDACIGFGYGELAAAVFGGALPLEGAIDVIADYINFEEEKGDLNCKFRVQMQVQWGFAKPRIIIYSGRNALPYKEPAMILKHLRNKYDPSDRDLMEEITLALKQQGVCKFIDPFSIL